MGGVREVVHVPYRLAPTRACTVTERQPVCFPPSRASDGAPTNAGRGSRDGIAPETSPSDDGGWRTKSAPASEAAARANTQPKGRFAADDRRAAKARERTRAARSASHGTSIVARAIDTCLPNIEPPLQP